MAQETNRPVGLNLCIAFLARLTQSNNFCNFSLLGEKTQTQGGIEQIQKKPLDFSETTFENQYGKLSTLGAAFDRILLHV